MGNFTAYNEKPHLNFVEWLPLCTPENLRSIANTSILWMTLLFYNIYTSTSHLSKITFQVVELVECYLSTRECEDIG